jgi:hypothetical protein
LWLALVLADLAAFAVAVPAYARQLGTVCLVLAPALLLVAPAPAGAQATDPRSVFTTLVTAVNAHNVDAALALFADTATVRIVPAPPPPERELYTGRQEIRTWLEGQVAQNIRVESRSLQVEGDRVTDQTQVYENVFRMLGLDFIETTTVVVVSGGRVTSFTSTQTPASLARLQAALARPPSGPTQLPRTGVAAPAAPAAGLAALLLLGGAAGCARRSLSLLDPTRRRVR